ncbi:Aminodeoxychorismate lyase [Beggiatoa sp. SS]|nr:Aminodeoxychorismate lyase [Beggiatoa sp. SS]
MDTKSLPPTPIAMTGRAALYAVAEPADGDSLFFVAKGDGSHYFSATNKEHECAVIEYQLKNKASKSYRNRCRRYPSCAACRR